MATVIVKKDEDLDHALKRFKKVSSQIRKEVRRREYYMSPKAKKILKQQERAKKRR